MNTMSTLSLLVAACSLFELSLSAPLPRSNAAAAHSLVERAPYTIFAGDGSTASKWPTTEDWVPFEDAWKANLPVISKSCDQFGVANNDETETAAIYDAIKKAATGDVTPEFILAIMMQESKGCVRVPTTAWSHANPGLMQSYMGTGSCNNDGKVTSPCSSDTITQMIKDGVGVGLDFGLQQAIGLAGKSDASKYYIAARMYNSGAYSLSASANLGAPGATECYASDVANRLVGWVDGSSRCKDSEVGTLAMSEDFVSSAKAKGNGNGNSNSQSPPAQAAPSTLAASTLAVPVATQLPTNQAPSTEANEPKKEEAPQTEKPKEQRPSTTVKPPAQNNAPSFQAQNFPGAKDGCTKWHTVAEADTCDKIKESEGVAFDTLRSLNNKLTDHALNDNCTNLWQGYKYCIA